MHIYPDLGLGNLFQSDNKSNKGKQVELHQTKTKEILNKMKRRPTGWEKTFANHVSIRLVYIVYTKVVYVMLRRFSRV